MGRPDPPAPNVAESMDSILKAYTTYGTGLVDVVNKGVLPTEQAKLEAAQATSPAYARLQTELFNQFGPELSKIGSKILEQQALDQASTDSKVLAGPGKDLVSKAIEVQKMADPEYYKTREITANRLGDLLGSVDLSGNLSGGETEAIRRGLSQENNARGTANLPSQSDIVAGATKYGEASHNRQMQGQGVLNAALQTANQSIPAMHSNVDAFQVATGRSSQTNPGANKFQNVNQNTGADAFNFANNTLNNATSLQNNAMDINSKRRDGLDRFNETFSSVIGSL